MKLPSDLDPIHAPEDAPVLAVSACLLGQNVRFNGGHKKSSLCTDLLGAHFRFHPVCPEMAIGLGVPREPLRLTGAPDSPRAVGVNNHEYDVTNALDGYGRKLATELDFISGMVVMRNSPSCGMERVKVYQEDGNPTKRGAGIFTASLRRARPELPVEEDGRLTDPVLRENFISRVYAYHQWHQVVSQGLTHARIVTFHSRYKYLLMAHNPAKYRELGRLVAGAGKQDPETFAKRYFPMFMQALEKCATRGTHTNVLQHIAGYLRRDLSAGDREEIARLITQYQNGTVPLVVPLTLLKHHFRRHPDQYIAMQEYMQPHPEALGLRNSI